MATSKKNPSVAEEIRSLSDAELLKEVKELKVELFKLRFQLATGQLEATSDIKKTRKDIARRLTILSERANASN
ncbi:MAG: 50S ribosomal protein L29 [Culicoidibacterales bacterium]